MMMFLLVGCFQYRLDSSMLALMDTSVDTSAIGEVLINGGTFTMGCTSEQGDDCGSDESPTHEVTLTRDFYIMESEVTQGLYEAVMGNNPSGLQGRDRPVENVIWYDAVEFANALSALQGLEECYSIEGEDVEWSNMDCIGWRLPTEAEWEYSARGGESYRYAGSDNVDEVAWYYDNSGYKTQDVCGKNRNGYGLCDMSGNVWEWVWDWHGDYSASPTEDPQGPTSGSARVLRGGSWKNNAWGVRVSNRITYSWNDDLGFRLARYSP